MGRGRAVSLAYPLEPRRGALSHGGNGPEARAQTRGRIPRKAHCFANGPWASLLWISLTRQKSPLIFWSTGLPHRRVTLAGPSVSGALCRKRPTLGDTCDSTSVPLHADAHCTLQGPNCAAWQQKADEIALVAVIRCHAVEQLPMVRIGIGLCNRFLFRRPFLDPVLAHSRREAGETAPKTRFKRTLLL